MTDTHKDKLHRYLVRTRASVLWKVEGLSEYDLRRPLTVTGSNLLGLVKHLAIVESRYFGESFGRPFTPHLPWWDDDQPADGDLWATADESSAEILSTYRAVTAHADETIAALDLDAPGNVSWWPRPEVTLHSVLVHVVVETARHAGHVDVLREQLDGRVGDWAPDPAEAVSAPSEEDERRWAEHRARVEAAAREGEKAAAGAWSGPAANR